MERETCYLSRQRTAQEKDVGKRKKFILGHTLSCWKCGWGKMGLFVDADSRGDGAILATVSARFQGGKDQGRERPGMLFDVILFADFVSLLSLKCVYLNRRRKHQALRRSTGALETPADNILHVGDANLVVFREYASKYVLFFIHNCSYGGWDM